MKKPDMQQLKNKVIDTRLPLKQRKAAAVELKEVLLNPVPAEDFNADTFDPNNASEFTKLIPRARVKPPRRLPNPHRLKPKEVMEGQMVGMYENKQDLYLLIVELSERISDLEDQLNP